MSLSLQQEEWTPIVCPTCDQLMWFHEFYTRHVYQRHGLHVSRCPFCLGKCSYSPKHAEECGQRFLESQRFVDVDVERMWTQRVMKQKKKCLKSKLACLDSKRSKMDLQIAYEELAEEHEKLKRIAHRMKQACGDAQSSSSGGSML